MPAAAPAHVYAYGAVVSVASTVPLRRNSTFVIAPSASDAVAASVIDAGATNVALFAGAVSATAGSALALACIAAPCSGNGTVVTADSTPQASTTDADNTGASPSAASDACRASPGASEPRANSADTSRAPAVARSVSARR